MTGAAEWRHRAKEAEATIALRDAELEAVNSRAAKIARDCRRMVDEERQWRERLEDELTALRGALATDETNGALLTLHRKAHAEGDEQTAGLAGMVLCERAKVRALREVADEAFDCGFAGWLGEQREGL